MVSGRGSHRPEKQPDPGVGANRQPTGRAKGSRLRFGLCVWCGLPCGGQSLPRRRPGAAALIMPICNTVAMNHHLGEISGQVAAPRFREGRLCPCRGHPRRGGLASQPRACGPWQYHLVGAAALQPGAQSGRANLALSAQPLARQLDISQSGGYHGCLRDGLEPVRHRSPPDPLTLRGRLGAGFVCSVGGVRYRAAAGDRKTHLCP